MADISANLSPRPGPKPEPERRTEPVKVNDSTSPPEREDMPLPQDSKNVYLAGLFFFATMAVLYVAKTVVLPIVLAIILKLLLQPVVRFMERFRIPRAMGALLCIVLLLGVLAGLGTVLASPASTAAQKLPEAWPKMKDQLGWLEQPIDAVKRAAAGLGLSDALPSDPGEILSKLNPGSLAGSVASGATGLLSHGLETLLILFYLLVFGETFLLRVVEILPRFGEKREAVEIAAHLESDMSAYLLTITVINAVVGLVTGGIMWAFGVPGAPLWGVLAFCLNYVPILGPFVGIGIFALVGLLTLGGTWYAILPAACYFGVHVAEGEIITPLLLAKRFTLNPVAVMLSLVIWYWMWGVTGAVLSVPLLAMTKIICDRLRPFRAFGHLLEG